MVAISKIFSISSCTKAGAETDLSVDCPDSGVVPSVLPCPLPHLPPLAGADLQSAPGEGGGRVGLGRADQLQAEAVLLGQVELVHGYQGGV